MKRKEKYSKENFENAIKNANSIKDALRNLNLRAAGGNYKIFHKYVKIYNIDTSHFISREIQNKTLLVNAFIKKISLNEILVENSNYNRTSLKNRLYNEDLKERKCELCGQGEEWKGKKMSLILDHINGVHDDNRIENLRIVCPNCNATLPTHCKGKKGLKESEKKEKNNSKNKKRKVERPNYEILIKEVKDIGYNAVGRKYGVSDNSIRKWIKFYEKYT
jgi:hypothetical protein